MKRYFIMKDYLRQGYVNDYSLISVDYNDKHDVEAIHRAQKRKYTNIKPISYANALSLIRLENLRRAEQHIYGGYGTGEFIRARNMF